MFTIKNYILLLETYTVINMNLETTLKARIVANPCNDSLI